ncbi:hypothetical protein BDV98DRAFT_7192 [Pterulicium gracile]|uniref:Uncharacterized protein n=1 Tax=Pterulicium gracile TaxID=1884261 RepID=A0A5C3QYF3_9AGAR|nr:hypothetical protein BDV98DRAFT_7192 [Pterula gracilis]
MFTKYKAVRHSIFLDSLVYVTHSGLQDDPQMEYSCSVFPLTMVKAWFFVEPAARSGIPLGCTDSARLLPFTISCIAFAVMMVSSTSFPSSDELMHRQSEEVIREVFETPLGTNSTINWEQRKSAYNTHIDNLKRLRSKSATTFAALLERLEQEVLTLTKCVFRAISRHSHSLIFLVWQRKKT